MEGGGSGGVRLHVGGLGESVGKDDLLKIFSPMGSVDAVEFVRTKGRSFAYIDFSPSSEKSLTKLFSTYNGCIWKGGRLRLEKAKEHYLARLKREWEEASSTPDVAIKAPDNSTPSTHLNVFIPRLRKVKAMPLSGTGKHKYSFQRVSVPSLLPKTFCDCEEHSASLTPQETHARDLEALNVGINEEEVSIMNSVMNKLLEKDNEDNEDKEDNIIINVVSGGNDMMDSELEILSRKRKSTLNETPASGAGYTEGRKGNNIHPSKKRQSIILEGSGRQESSQAIPEKKKPSEADQDKSMDEPSRKTDVKRSSDSISWSQKSSWKALVANGNSSNFTVSSFLPGPSFSEAVQPSSSQENSEELVVPSSTARPSVTSKIKKTKSKRLTSTIMAENLPVTDDIEMNDSTASDSVGSDHSEDTEDTDISVETDLVASTDGDSENDSLNVENDENVDGDSENDSLNLDKDEYVEGDSENDSLNVENDENVDGDSENDSLNLDKDEYVEGDSENDSLNVENDEDVAEDLIVEEGENVEGDSENDSLNVEIDETVAEDLNAGKENLVLKDDVDEEEAGKAPLEACSKSTGGSSWLQRASWTQLVSDKNASFSITQLFPGLASDKSEAAKVNNNGDNRFSNTNQSESGMKQRDFSCSSNGFEGTGVKVDSTPVRSLEENRQSLKGKNVSEGCRLAAKKPIRKEIGSGETCTFMRSATSLKEWEKAKKALGEPRRRKKSEE
ncbi:unnamed protein product [Thlaspi arvense]|uniref:RRM domain-containing protein n=1 Tax=Thlaspi arvense TaxID=13288 RepID=A0AAU9SRJ0_THLAR|nr:unnamed protein product [Thlaspi arvense]